MSRKKKLFGFGTVFFMLLALAPLAAAQGTAVQVTQNATLGEILTDSQGMTLYMFTKDEPNVTNCYDGCATAWPPLLVADGEEPMAGAGLTGQLGVIDRTDGGRQVTYNGMPLYYFANDSVPGDTNGQGVNDVWFVLNPDAPSVTVSDQEIKDGSVTIARVVAAEPGWLVVHAAADGKPGPVVGHSALDPGENTDVGVQIDAAQATPTLFAMLHVDRGTIGTYEFPGDDRPVTLAGQVVTPPFQVTGELPATLPTAGASPSPTPWLLILLAVGALALFTGFGLSLARRSR
jgi:predicted lipoprotein with Yx(FWY)xxD motif